jgi:hypothetical protein
MRYIIIFINNDDNYFNKNDNYIIINKKTKRLHLIFFNTKHKSYILLNNYNYVEYKVFIDNVYKMLLKSNINCTDDIISLTYYNYNKTYCQKILGYKNLIKRKILSTFLYYKIIIYYSNVLIFSKDYYDIYNDYDIKNINKKKLINNWRFYKNLFFL